KITLMNKNMFNIKMAILTVRNSVHRSPLRLGLFFIPLVLAWFALLPASRAVSPAPDGGYLNNNTAEGTDSLFKLTTGANNTAIGFHALHENTTGGANTATGATALFNNTGGSDNVAIGNNTLFSN